MTFVGLVKRPYREIGPGDKQGSSWMLEVLSPSTTGLSPVQVRPKQQEIAELQVYVDQWVFVTLETIPRMTEIHLTAVISFDPPTPDLLRRQEEAIHMDLC